MGNPTDPRFNESDAAIIHWKAQKMVGHYGYSKSDVEDIEQELAMHVVQISHRYEPARASRGTFISKATKNKLLNMIERRTARKRDQRRNAPLDESGSTLLDDGSMTADQIALQLDMKAAAAQMEPELREVLDLRCADHTEADIQRLTGRTRGQVRTLMKHLAEHLTEHGLNPHKSPDATTIQPTVPVIEG